MKEDAGLAAIVCFAALFDTMKAAGQSGKPVLEEGYGYIRTYAESQRERDELEQHFVFWILAHEAARLVGTPVAQWVQQHPNHGNLHLRAVMIREKAKRRGEEPGGVAHG
jgi:hypothetical protein